VTASEAVLNFLISLKKARFIQMLYSKLQIGAGISPKRKNLWHFIQETESPIRSTTTARELIFIVETVKEFCIILLGQRSKSIHRLKT
jgi:hypothetical protein